VTAAIMRKRNHRTSTVTTSGVHRRF
jgi:hypothetical protein